MISIDTDDDGKNAESAQKKVDLATSKIDTTGNGTRPEREVSDYIDIANDMRGRKSVTVNN